MDHTYSNTLFNKNLENERRYITSSFSHSLLKENYLGQILSKMKYLTRSYLIFIIFTYILSIIFGALYISNPCISIVNIILLLFSLNITYLYFLEIPIFWKSFIEIVSYVLFLGSLFNSLFFCIESKFDKLKIFKIIYFLIFTKNFSLLIWSQSIFFIWLISCVLNIGFLVGCIFLLKEFMIEEILFEIIISLATYSFKEILDSLLRNNFTENNKYKSYFYYNKNLINSSAGFHFTFYENKLSYINDKANNLLNFLVSNFDFKSI